MAKHQYRAGIIGNCAYNALVQEDTQVVWMCLPRFDSSFIFGSWLDKNKGGEFSIMPAERDARVRYEQKYIRNTNVLETRVETAEGSYRVTDFAPRFYLYGRYFKPLMMFRKIERLSGHPRIRVICKPVGEYGARPLKASIGSNHIRYHGLRDSLRLTSDIPLSYLLDEQDFVLDQTKYLALCYGPPLEAPLDDTAEQFLRKTTDYWHTWVMHVLAPNIHQESFIRSTLALKLHQYEDTGAVIASTTMGLPEAMGAERNWDYRYCWMRDTYYTMHAMSELGHFEEVECYFQYVLNIVKENKRYQPLYRISGQPLNKEEVLDLHGYQGNRPVYLGNQAAEHIQNDAYGQVLLALLPLYYDQRLRDNYKDLTHMVIREALDMIEETIDEPDAGLWEFRNQVGMHCYTALFHWAGAHAAEKIASIIMDQAMVKKAKRLQQLSAQHIEACYSQQKKGYVQQAGSVHMDASTLQLINMKYLPSDSARAKEHLQALEKELMAEKGLFYRYKHADDFGVPKTTFLLCAFWHVEALACVGSIDRALECFEHLLHYGNHLGLFSEGVNELDGSQWGNFPQVYSHVGLITSLIRISRSIDKPAFLVHQ